MCRGAARKKGNSDSALFICELDRNLKWKPNPEALRISFFLLQRLSVLLGLIEIMQRFTRLECNLREMVIESFTAHRSCSHEDHTRAWFTASQPSFHKSSDCLVPGPSSRSSSSPSRGPCSPESSFKHHIYQSDSSLQLSDDFFNFDVSLPPQITPRSNCDKDCCFCLSSTEETSTLQTLEIDLRSACANALSICAFGFKEDGFDSSDRQVTITKRTKQSK